MTRNHRRSAPSAQSAAHLAASVPPTPASSPISGEQRILQALIDSHLAAANVLKQALRGIETKDSRRPIQAALPEEQMVQATVAPPAPEKVDWHLVTVAEACRGLGIGRTTLYAMVAAKKLSVVKIGRRTLLKVAELQELGTPRIR